MTAQNRIESRVTRSVARLRTTLLAVLVVGLAACGGGGDTPAPQAPSSSSGGSLTDAFACIVGAIAFGACPDATTTGGVTASGACDDLFSFYCVEPVVVYPTNGFELETSVAVLDIEPNDDVSTPAVATFSNSDPKLGLMGFETLGRLSAGLDRIDTFILTAPRALDITLQLCRQRGAQCDEKTAASSLDVTLGYLEILDLNGDLLASSANDFADGNVVSLRIDGGVPYYVSVAGGVWSWGSDELDAPTDLDYYLRVIGTEPTADAPPADPGLVAPRAPQLMLSAAGTMSATLDWIAPSLNTDGTVLVDLQGYVLYYGDVEGGPYALQQPLDLGLSSYTSPLPDYGAWYFAITAVNAAGIESELSNEVMVLDPPPMLP